MTEEEWIAALEPKPMLESLAQRASERKLRLFGLLCCRQSIDRFQDPRFHAALEIADGYVDGKVDESTLYYADRAALEALCPDEVDEFDGSLLAPLFLVAPYHSVQSEISTALIAAETARPAGELSFHGIDSELMREQSTFLRDIFGNPFQPISFDPSWRTSTAVAIAKAMYDSRDFAAMPLLADALQDAGCADDRILDHCRGPGLHVKGCWVVDLVLGKE